MSKMLRVGLVGCGGQTRLNLAPAFSRMDSARLVSCADVDEARARQVADAFGIDAVHDSAEEVTKCVDVDAVVVAVPHRYLKDVALSAVGAGKHVFIEKPMGLNAAEGAEVVDAAESRGVVAMVGYCMRYSLSRMFIKSLLDRGTVGDISFVAAGKGGGPLGGWLGGPYAEGGGQLLFLGSHLTDQVLWMTGDDAESASGIVRWNAGDTDETSVYTVRLKGGAVATFSVSQASGVGYDFVDVYGTRGRVRGDWKGDVVTVESRVIPEYAHPTVLRIPGDSLEEMCFRELAAFVEAANSGARAPIPVSDGLNVLRILDAVVASSKTGSWIDV